jgi:hypothetical protein
VRVVLEDSRKSGLLIAALVLAALVVSECLVLGFYGLAYRNFVGLLQVAIGAYLGGWLLLSRGGRPAMLRGFAISAPLLWIADAWLLAIVAANF